MTYTFSILMAHPGIFVMQVTGCGTSGSRGSPL
jgi:hypothetical protein